MSDMIERVARAIAWYEVSEFDRAFMEFHGTNASNFLSWDHCIPKAVAALDAMREPTEEMEAAEIKSRNDRDEFGGVKIGEIYRSMIDAALSIPKPKETP